MAFSAVVLPAPLGPMSPTMRPSSMRKSIPSSATVDPKALRRPRASMDAIALALLLLGVGLRPAVCGTIQQFFGFQPEPPDGCIDHGPLFGEELLPLAREQQIARAHIDEHPKSSPLLDQLLVHQLLISLQNRERVHAILGRDRAYGRQRVAFLEHAVEDHRYHTIPKLAVNRLTVVPFSVHPVFQIVLGKDCRSLCALQVQARDHGRLSLQHKSPLLDVMARVDNREHSVLHVSTL